MIDPTAARQALIDLTRSRDTLAAYVDDAETLLDSLSADLATAQQVVHDQDVTIGEQRDEIARLETEILRLEQLLDEQSYQGPLIGAAFEKPTMLAELEALVGKIGVRRVFSSGAPAISHFAADLVAGRSVAYSFKTMPADHGRAFVTGLVGYLGSLAPRRSMWARLTGKAAVEAPPVMVSLTWYHEPEDNFTTLAEQARFRQESMSFAAAIAECVPPGVRIVQQVIFMAWSTQPESGRDLTNWYTRDMWDAGIKCIGWDIYQPRQTDDRKRQTFDQRSVLIDAFHKRMADAGWPVARTIMECGHYEVPGQPTIKGKWLYDLEAWCLRNEVGAVCYFQNANGVISVGADYPITAAYPQTAGVFRDLCNLYRPEHLV